MLTVSEADLRAKFKDLHADLDADTVFSAAASLFGGDEYAEGKQVRAPWASGPYANGGKAPTFKTDLASAFADGGDNESAADLAAKAVVQALLAVIDQSYAVGTFEFGGGSYAFKLFYRPGKGCPSVRVQAESSQAAQADDADEGDNDA